MTSVMSLLDFLFYLLVEPLRLLFEVIFFYAYKFTSNCGLSIIAMSLVVNFLLLPLYFRADKLEKEQNDKKKAMEPRVNLIKKAFKGDERVMMLQAYYRQNNYKSTDVLKESVSLFLQIPFFIAAYSFLSGLKILNGISLGPIHDLGAPDALIHLGTLSINLLPILMTVINIISGFIYSEKGHIKDKLKLILIALVFLVLLYNSPSGLVFYWTLNNLFSLCKNIVVHFRKTAPESEPKKIHLASFPIILLSSATLAVLTGVMIPADVIVENPAELINQFSINPVNPIHYLMSSTLIAIGLFLIWIPLFAYLTKEKSVPVLVYLFPALAFTGILNYVVFNKNFGILTKKLIYEYEMSYDAKSILMNLGANIALAVVIVLFIYKFRKFAKPVLLMSLIAVIMLSAMRFIAIVVLASDYNVTYNNTADDIRIPLSTEGQNVVVIMMDRMIGAQLPYIMNERPDVAEQFDGFTFYPNTVSFGNATNNGSPALFGGYDYTPARMNARTDLLLVDKHNEALRLMPEIFSENGWTVTVGDAPYADYEWIPDMSIFNDIENVSAYNLSGALNSRSEVLMELGDEYDTRLNRNFFCYGLMKAMPYLIQPLAYSSGNYNYMNFYSAGNGSVTFDGGNHVQSGLYEPYLQERLVLESLSDLTEITNSDENCFFMFANGTTHETSLLAEPSYEPAVNVDNTDYDAAHEDRFILNGLQMDMSVPGTYAHYESSMSACILLGEWFDYLRENGLYDNTRIIIVADHGYGFHQFEDLQMYDINIDVEALNPVLLVKDFGSTGFTTSYEFMTNADTPSLAFRGVIDNPVNPYTGNPVSMDNKADEQLIYLTVRANVLSNNGVCFEDSNEFWLTVRDNIWERSCWDAYDPAS